MSTSDRSCIGLLFRWSTCTEYYLLRDTQTATRYSYLVSFFDEVPPHFFTPLFFNRHTHHTSDRRSVLGRADSQHCYYACRGADGPKKVVGASASVNRQPGDGEFKGEILATKTHKKKRKLFCFEYCCIIIISYLVGGWRTDTVQGSTYWLVYVAKRCAAKTYQGIHICICLD